MPYSQCFLKDKIEKIFDSPFPQNTKINEEENKIFLFLQLKEDYIIKQQSKHYF